ncbi:hypothetical protein [Mycobacterium sp.]|uniref:hypothetical protein n=1 Tax=Mycobacterium sp. TaxID=1785 RepID=UPI003F9C243D
MTYNPRRRIDALIRKVKFVTALALEIAVILVIEVAIVIAIGLALTCGIAVLL